MITTWAPSDNLDNKVRDPTNRTFPKIERPTSTECFPEYRTKTGAMAWTPIVIKNEDISDDTTNAYL